MRNLTPEEIDKALDDNGEAEEGCVAIEATVQESADLKTDTCCGRWGNQTFKALADKGYGHRKCRGWFNKTPKQMSQETWEGIHGQGPVPVLGPLVCGMFLIKIQTEKTGEKVERIAGAAGGSLRYDGDSLWEGFKEFEIE
jgi:hypothetical protein